MYICSITYEMGQLHCIHKTHWILLDLQIGKVKHIFPNVFFWMACVRFPSLSCLKQDYVWSFISVCVIYTMPLSLFVIKNKGSVFPADENAGVELALLVTGSYYCTPFLRKPYRYLKYLLHFEQPRPCDYCQSIRRDFLNSSSDGTIIWFVVYIIYKYRIYYLLYAKQFIRTGNL